MHLGFVLKILAYIMIVLLVGLPTHLNSKFFVIFLTR